MTIYKVTLTDGQVFRLGMDTERAEAGITADWGNGHESTPYQSANFATGLRFSAEEAAQQIARDSAEGDQDCTDVATVEEITDPAAE